MDNWSILGIDPTKDKALIKQAYMEKLSVFHPEDDPEGFKKLRAAYEALIKSVDEEEEPKEIDFSPEGIWMHRVEELYNDFELRIDEENWRQLLQDPVCFQLDSSEDISNRLLTYFMDYFYIPQKVWIVLDEHFHWLDREEELKENFPENFITFVVNSIKYSDDIRYDSFSIEEGKDYENFISLYYQMQRAFNNRDDMEKEEFENTMNDLLEQIEALGIIHPDFIITKIRYNLMTNKIEEARELGEDLIEQYPEDYRVYFAVAEVEWRSDNIEKAKELYEKVIATVPNHIGATKGLGDCYSKLKDYEKAKDYYIEVSERYPYDEYISQCIYSTNCELVEYYKEKLKESPEETGIKFSLAWTLFEINKYEECKQVGIEISPGEDDKYQYYDLMGRCSSSLKQYEEALSYFDKWLEDEPENSYVLNNKGYQLQCLGRTEEALECYEKGLNTNPESINLIVRKAYLLTELERYDEAIDLCDRGIEIDSGVAHLYLYKAKALYNTGRYREAIDNCESEISIYPYFVDTYLIEIKIYFEVGQNEAVLDIIKRVEELQLNNDEILLYKIRTLRKIEKYSEAKELCLDILKDDPKNEDVNYELAIVLACEGNFEKAIKFMNASIEANPSEMYKYYSRAMMYVDLNEDYEAIEEYDYIISKVPDDGEAYRRKADIYRRLGKEKEAIEAYKRTLEVDPKDEYSNNELGEIYSDSGDYQTAVHYFTKQLEVSESEYYYINRGLAYASMDNIDKAKADYEKAIAICPDSYSAYNNIGCIYKDNKEYSKAIEYFEKSVEIEPTFEKGYKNIAKCYVNMDKLEEAIKAYTRGIEAVPNSESLYYERGRIYKKLEKFDKTVEDYKKELEITPEDDYLYNDLGVVFEEEIKDYESALKCYLKAIELNSNNEYAFRNVGDVYYKGLKEYIKAAEYYGKQMEVSPNNLNLYISRGKSYEKAGEKRKAESDYKCAIKKYLEKIKEKEQDACTYKYLGECYKRLKKFRKAIKYLQIAIEKASNCKNCELKNCHEGYFCLGEIYEAKGNYGEALANYKKALEINPDDDDNEYKEAIARVEGKK
ncbi:tetratricopeptide repeat protein [Inconstantimicrobium mannanitabidum]|uniref:Uncharacterized protein n=1 Tax=Inconstantimicrobium mannanitabidum TaxID=1604901 RepID=A0ACB5RE66_9CLOT|nr:tetratricopeptide repeat protein [Clostridium sp. TW13]GKX67054.1 hypothetical protein rsdtw13_23120 [Clostridium sp. TW13]